MKNIFKSFLIGIIAGTIDVVPMIFQRLDKPSCLSAFIHWVVLGFIIPYVKWNMQPWLKGLLIAEMTVLPILVLVFNNDATAVIPIIIFSAILGIAVGIAGSKFIK